MNPTDPNNQQQAPTGQNPPVGYAGQATVPGFNPGATAPTAAGVSQPITASSVGQPQVAKQPVKSNPNSTQNTLQIAEIRDGVVIMNDGSFRSVIMCKSINFDLMSQQEQEGVELGYQQFLNSLEFPIQIYMRSKRIDLAPYIEKLDKIRSEHDNMLLAMLMEDYITYIDNLSQQVNIMEKDFYVIIPYYMPGTNKLQGATAQQQTSSKNFIGGLIDLFSHTETHVVIDEAKLETAKNELRNRVQSVLNGLLQCGVQGLPLDTQELIELYYDTYNPDTSTRQQLKDFDNMSADIITKGQGQATQAHLQGGMS